MENPTPTVSIKVCAFPECGLDHYCRGYCIGHYRQHMRGRELRPLRRRADTFNERFWQKVDKSGDCWEWTGTRIKDGYGRISVNAKLELAHRASYVMEYGPIPPGVLIDHRCHNPSCVRPSHLRPVTSKENQENRRGATRASKTGYRGVFPSGNGRFIAAVKHGDDFITLGSFDSAQSAHAAAKAKRNELFHAQRRRPC